MKRQHITDNNTALHVVTVAGKGSFDALPDTLAKTWLKAITIFISRLATPSAKATNPLQHIRSP